MKTILAALALALLPLSTSGCFSPEEPICSFACGDNGACPDNYECRTDGYCHRKGTTESCLFSDAAVAPDLAGMTDMSVSPDLAPDLLMSLEDAGTTD